MSAPELESLYRRWLAEVWEQGRTDVASELMTDDVIDHNPYPGQPPGLEGHNWAVAMVRRAFPDLRFTADVVVSDSDLVAGRWTMTGTNTGVFDLFGLPPTGRPVTMTGQEIFRARSGKFAEVWHQEDAPGMLRQLGLEPPQAIMRLAARRSARRYRRRSSSTVLGGWAVRSRCEAARALLHG
jgi:predicted ester cyclase